MSTVVAEVAARTEWVRSLCVQYRGKPGEMGRHIDALCKSAEALLAQADPAADLRAALESVVAAERYLRLALELENQHRDQTSAVLAFACSAARDGYRKVIRRAGSLRLRPLGSGEAPLGRWQFPAVLLEPMRTPATYVRGAQMRARGLRGPDERDLLPFPIVMMPWYPESALRALSIVQHEIGHDLDEDLRITSELEVALDAALRDAEVPSGERAHWVGWTRELVADAFGTMLAGAAFAVELIGWAAVVTDATTTHPAPGVRIAVCDRILGQLGVAPADPTRQRLAAAAQQHAMAPYSTRAERVARVLLTTELRGLEGVTLADLAPAVGPEHTQLTQVAVALAAVVRPVAGDPDRIEALAKTICADADPLTVLGAVPVRLFSSLAACAIDAGADAKAVAAVLFAHAKARPEEATGAFQAAVFAQRTLKALRSPILDEAQDGLKLPPPDLFAVSRSISFVGATHDGLEKLFQDYLENGGAKKALLEIFFLTDHAVRRLDHAARDADAHARGRAAALAALTPALLSSVAERWIVYEQDDPFFFASYWDADAAGGRIHVSCHGWGQDIKRAPGLDHVWAEGERVAGRTYRWYLDALAGLRLRAKLLSSRV